MVSARFETYARTILKRKAVLAPKTAVAAKHHISRLMRAFRGVPLTHFNEGHWVRYIVRERRANPSRRFYDDRKYLRAVLNAALREGLIARHIELPNPDVPRRIGREILQAELTLIFKSANPELQLQIEIAYKMGMRLREMLHLRWERFDWAEGIIKLEPCDTKTRRGRTFPINDDVMGRLRELHSRSRSPYVFPSRYDLSRPRDDNKTAWKAALRRAGVRARWHDLRHTAASLMLRRGATVPIVRAYLGMSERVLTEIYQHLNMDELRAVARLMSTGSGR